MKRKIRSTKHEARKNFATFLGMIGMWGLLFPVARINFLVAQENEVTGTPTITETDENVVEEIKQKVQERLSKAARPKKAYVGTLSDIAENTLQINTAREGLKMAAVDEETEIVRVEKGSQSKVKINELPVGEFVIAMGYLEGGNGNGNGQVLSAKRVMSSPLPVPDAREVFWGQVANLEKNGDFLLAGEEGKSFQIKTSQKTEYSTVTEGETEEFKEDLEEGMKVIVVGIPDKKEESLVAALLIHVVAAGGAEETSLSPTPTGKR